MGTGIIITLLFIVVCLRYAEKRIGKGKTSIFTKIHIPASILLALVAVAHIVITLPFLDARPISIYITGFAIMFFILLAVLNRFMVGKGKIKIHRIAALLAGIFIVLHIATNLVGVTVYQNQVSNIVVENIDLTNIPDGIYVGEYDVTYVYAKVEVTVQSGRITNIEILEHRGGTQGIPAEAIVYTIYEQQRIDVDTVSGATNSSRVIQAAILDALPGDYN